MPNNPDIKINIDVVSRDELAKARNQQPDNTDEFSLPKEHKNFSDFEELEQFVQTILLASESPFLPVIFFVGIEHDETGTTDRRINQEIGKLQQKINTLFFELETEKGIFVFKPKDLITADPEGVNSRDLENEEVFEIISAIDQIRLLLKDRTFLWKNIVAPHLHKTSINKFDDVYQRRVAIIISLFFEKLRKRIIEEVGNEAIRSEDLTQQLATPVEIEYEEIETIIEQTSNKEISDLNHARRTIVSKLRKYLKETNTFPIELEEPDPPGSGPKRSTITLKIHLGDLLN